MKTRLTGRQKTLRVDAVYFGVMIPASIVASTVLSLNFWITFALVIGCAIVFSRSLEVNVLRPWLEDDADTDTQEQEQR